MKATARVAIVVLAAGMGRRMGVPHHKLLPKFDGIALIRRVAASAVLSGGSPVIVVTGHRNDEIERAVSDLPVIIEFNRQYASGMASSLKAGFALAVSQNVNGVLIMLADMPSVTTGDLDKLITEFCAANAGAVVRAGCGGAIGHPYPYGRRSSG